MWESTWAMLESTVVIQVCTVDFPHRKDSPESSWAKLGNMKEMLGSTWARTENSWEKLERNVAKMGNRRELLGCNLARKESNSVMLVSNSVK